LARESRQRTRMDYEETSARSQSFCSPSSRDSRAKDVLLTKFAFAEHNYSNGHDQDQHADDLER
jgi:hypothetical protein